MPKVSSGQQMRSAERLLQVLKCFGGPKPTLSVAEISRALDLAQSTVRRLLDTLEKHGFVRQGDAERHYRLHYEPIRLAAAALGGSSLVAAAAPILDELRDSFDEAVQLAVRDGADVVTLDKRASSHQIETSHRIGHRYPSYRGSASGRVLLAWLPEDVLAPLLPQSGTWPAYTAHSVADGEGLREVLEQTRKQGHAINDRETTDGLWAVAAPVRALDGSILAAICMPCPITRLSKQRRTEITAAVKQAARRLSDAVPFAA